MTKSELIELIARRQTQFSQKDVEIAVNQIVDSMINTLSQGERIEIRGFGSFSLHHRKARVGRNPKTGEKVELNDKRVPHFKPGKALREAVDSSKDHTDIILQSTKVFAENLFNPAQPCGFAGFFISKISIQII